MMFYTLLVTITQTSVCLTHFKLFMRTHTRARAHTHTQTHNTVTVFNSSQYTPMWYMYVYFLGFIFIFPTGLWNMFELVL